MRHLNLLPQRRRKDLKREVVLLAATRFLSSALYAVVLLTVVGVVASVGMWVMAFVGVRTAEVGLTLQLAEYNTVRQGILQRNFLLKSVDQVGTGRVVWSDVLARLLALIPPDVKIDTLTVDATQSFITFSGTATTRASLVVLEDRLRQLPWVLEVNAPRENLLQRFNPSYTVGLKVDVTQIVKTGDNGET